MNLHDFAVYVYLKKFILLREITCRQNWPWRRWFRRWPRTHHRWADVSIKHLIDLEVGHLRTHHPCQYQALANKTRLSWINYSSYNIESSCKLHHTTTCQYLRLDLLIWTLPSVPSSIQQFDTNLFTQFLELRFKI